MHTLLLVLHLVGAGIAAVLVIASVVAVIFHRANRYRPLALSVAGIGVLQIISGSLLAFTSGGTFLSFCIKISVYLAVLTATDVMLLIAAHRARSLAAVTR